MLSLDSPRWAELQHAYGDASDIPELLAQLHSLPASKGNAEPWFSLWSALAHQGDVFCASFAAVPHVIAALAIDPGRADESFFQFPAWVEICRAKQQITVMSELEVAYFEALQRLPALAAQAMITTKGTGFTACLLSATAAAQGEYAIAEAVLEMASPEVAPEFLEWLSQR